MEPLVHVLLPLLFLLVFFPKLEKKYVFGLLFLTILIDFDFLLGHSHRYLFHNIFFVVLISLFVYVLWDKKAFFVSLYYLFSHLLIDIYHQGPVALLWPIYKKFFILTLEVLYLGGFNLQYKFNVITKSLSEISFIEGGHLFTEIGLVLLVFTLVLGITAYRKEIKKLFKKLF